MAPARREVTHDQRLRPGENPGPESTAVARGRKGKRHPVMSSSDLRNQGQAMFAATEITETEVP